MHDKCEKDISVSDMYMHVVGIGNLADSTTCES